MVTVDQVLSSLKKVVDPELHKDIVSMGMIKDLSITDSKVAFTLELTTPACPITSRGWSSMPATPSLPRVPAAI